MSQMLFRPLRQIADKFNTLQMGMVAAERIFKIISMNSNIDDSGNKSPKIIHGKISIKNLRFSYSRRKVINGINLEIQPSETIAIVGSTGAGKSTLINLLSRFYEYDSGQIYLDEMSIRDFSIKSLRGHLGVVLQEVFLFADTIFNNITLKNPDISIEMVKRVAKEIGVDKFIESLPEVIIIM